MKASEIIIQSIICKQAAANIHPEAPDELFNEAWLKLREKEIRDPHFMPNDPKRYFIRSMRNTKLHWLEKQQNKRIHEPKYLPPETAYGIEYEKFLIEWINTPTQDEDLLFLKNILTLAMYCSNINDAIRTCEMSRASFWKYRKIAEKRVYDDFNAANIGHVLSSDLL